MRLLLQRHDRESGRAAFEKRAAQRGADPHGNERTSVPLWNLSANLPCRAARVTASTTRFARRDDGGESMTRHFPLRRDFLKTGGALVIGFPLRQALFAQETGRENGARGTTAGPPDAKQVDTWLAIHADNTATIYIEFAARGHGTSTALLQVAAEELDMDVSQLKSVRLDTNVTPNQGGTYSSASIQRGGPQVRTAAAEARQ